MYSAAQFVKEEPTVFGLEGNEFTGKSTILKIIKSRICPDSRWLFTYEPGSSFDDSAEKYRDAIFKSKSSYIDPMALQIGMFASRVQQDASIKLSIKMDEGVDFVFKDRTYFTSIPYFMADYWTDPKKPDYELFMERLLFELLRMKKLIPIKKVFYLHNSYGTALKRAKAKMGERKTNFYDTLRRDIYERKNHLYDYYLMKYGEFNALGYETEVVKYDTDAYTDPGAIADDIISRLEY